MTLADIHARNAVFCAVYSNYSGHVDPSHIPRNLHSQSGYGSSAAALNALRRTSDNTINHGADDLDKFVVDLSLSTLTQAQRKEEDKDESAADMAVE